MKTLARRTLALWALVLIGSVATAQDTASISGRVTSDDGTALPSATVTTTNVASDREKVVATDAEGRYEIVGLTPGNYRLTVSILGFNEAGLSVNLPAGDAVTQDITLGVGTITEEITVTATKGIERSTSEIPQVVTVITAKDLEERQVGSVAHAIARAPNVRSIDQNPTRARPQFRGLASSRVLILVDGERLNNVRFDAGATGISPSMIDVTQVESIEVLGGAGSGIYGTDAMAGVINIVTKQPSQVGSNRQLDLDFDFSYNENSEYFKGVLTGNYSSPKFALRAVYSDFELEGWTAGDGAVTKEQVVNVARFSQEVAQATGGDVANSFAIWEFPDGTQVFNGSGEGFNFQSDLWLFPSDNHSFRLKFLTSQHEGLGLPFSTPPTDPTLRRNEFRDLRKFTFLYESYDVASWLPRVSIRAYRQNFRRPQDDNRFNIDAGSSFNPSDSTFTGNLSTFTRGREQTTLNDVDSTGFEFQANIQPWRDAVLTTGVTWLTDESTDIFSFESFDATGQAVTFSEQGVATTPDTEYENQAFFAVLEWSPAPWIRLDGGLRYDK